MRKNTAAEVFKNTQKHSPNDLPPLPVRLVSAGTFFLLCAVSLVLPVPTPFPLKLASFFVLLAGCLVFYAGTSRLLAPSLFLLLAYIFRCLPFYSLFLMLGAPLALYGLLVWKIPLLHPGRRAFVVEKIEKRPLAIAIFVTVLSIIGLVLWYIQGDVDFSGFTDAFSNRGTLAVILGGVGFSVVNVIVSETIFRGVVWQGIEECIPGAVFVVLIQGLLYGASHFWGAIPNGWEGAILSGIFALFLGIIRHASRGVLLPMAAHLCVDLTLLALVLNFLGRF